MAETVGMSSDDAVSLRQNRAYKFCEGWLEHKGQTAHGSGYVRLWLVLQGNVIYIFINNNATVDNQVGNLTIDAQTSFSVRGGDAKKGYKFDLSSGNRLLNRFKSRKLSERELWRGYIIGISKGKLPRDLDLLDGEVEKLQSDIDAYVAGVAPSGYRESTFSEDSGVETIDGHSQRSVSASGSAGSSSEERTLDNGGPTMVHKFYYDRSRDQTAPGWFVSQCSRQLAEGILETASEYGNTLMRESTTHHSNGSYVISKRVSVPGERLWHFEHYEVMRTARGYKLNVENPHDPMRSLSEVMDYFVKTSGGSSRPLVTNDLNKLGLNMPDYDRLIPAPPAAQPWVWPPEDYEEKHSPPKSSGRAPQRAAPQTVTAGILRNKSPRNMHNKQVEFSHTDVHDRHTVTGHSTRARLQVPSKDEFLHRHRADQQLKNLDNVISDFDTDRVYYNEKDIFTDARVSGRPAQRHSVAAIPQTPPTPPPPPLPCGPRSPPYVNTDREEGLHSSTSTLDQLPVAPPPPRDPVRSQDNQRQRVGSQFPSQTTTHAPVRPVASVQPTSPTRPAVTPVQTTKFGSTQVQTTKSGSTQVQKERPAFKKSVSTGQFTGHAATTGSPSAFPQWNAGRAPELRSSVAPPPVSPADQSGIDDADQGGVNTLRSRFENLNTGSQNPVLRKKAVPSSGFRKSGQPDANPGPATGRTRRMTEPNLRSSLDTFEGLRPEFKIHLEGLFSGGSPASQPLRSPMSPHASSDDPDHLYEELPQIPPDDVTYLNDLPPDDGRLT